MLPEAFSGHRLSGARLNGCVLTDVVMRGPDAQGIDIDDPWLLHDGGVVLVNGIDVVPFVCAELLRRFPGRVGMRATDPGSLRDAWAAVEQAWAGILQRLATMPAGTTDMSVDGEWSFSQTLRHLVLATDIWLRRSILGIEVPFHPLVLPNDGFAEASFDDAVFTPGVPEYSAVLQARSGRVSMVRDFLATLESGVLGEAKQNPWNLESTESTLSCLHVILAEEWEHLRFAVRDLDALENRG